jgi:CRISPR-associated protein Cas5d
VWVLKEYPKGTFPWPRSASVAAREGKRLRNFYANVDRASRNTVAVRDVDYLVEAWILLSANAGPEDNLAKFSEMFERRLTKGQHVYQPYLGCREFPAKVLPPGDAPKPIRESRDLGWMLHDLEYGRERSPRFFRAQLKNGIIAVPAWKLAVRR